jgi:RNA polymerase sigma-70 factor, ECF subfamily
LRAAKIEGPESPTGPPFYPCETARLRAGSWHTQMTRLNAKIDGVPAIGASDVRSSIDRDAACLDAFLAELDHVHATLRCLGIAPSDIEDLVQEVFLVLLRKWTNLDHGRPLRPYVFGIVFRIALGHRRKHRREVPSWRLESAADQTADLDDVLQNQQARRLILAALDRVPLGRRAVLLMHDLDEVPVAEIACVLGIRLFTAYARLRKARRELASALRRILKRTCHEVLTYTLPARAQVRERP